MMRDKKGRFVKSHLVAGRVRDKLGRFVKMDNHGELSLVDKEYTQGEHSAVDAGVQSRGNHGEQLVDRYFVVVKEVNEFLKKLEGGGD